MIFGANALIVKPAISLSPMLVVAILNNYGYSKLKDKSSDNSSIELKHAMFLLICSYPAVIGIIQVISWSNYMMRRKSKQMLIDI